ncbi:MAG: hypothetical protein K2X69_16235 [Silvanigrellaceae bacterium]|nr:hypothetical protein [Silvanigrellaceae bacterium]
MALSRFRSNFRFALHKEASNARGDIPLNQFEKIGNWLSWCVYELRFFVTSTVCDVRFVTAYFTLVAMIFTAFLFYPLDTLEIFWTACRWIFGHINWGYLRFALWLLSEITIFGIGIRALGRFSNRELLEHHGIVS